MHFIYTNNNTGIRYHNCVHNRPLCNVLYPHSKIWRCKRRCNYNDIPFRCNYSEIPLYRTALVFTFCSVLDPACLAPFEEHLGRPFFLDLLLTIPFSWVLDLPWVEDFAFDFVGFSYGSQAVWEPLASVSSASGVDRG